MDIPFHFFLDFQELMYDNLLEIIFLLDDFVETHEILIFDYFLFVEYHFILEDDIHLLVVEHFCDFLLDDCVFLDPGHLDNPYDLLIVDIFEL